MSLPPTSPSATGTPSGLAAPDRNVLRSELIRARKALDPAEWERHSAAGQRRNTNLRKSGKEKAEKH